MRNTISKAIAAMTMLLLFTVNVNAQEKAIEGAKILTEQFKEHFSLSGSQYDKVSAINMDFMKAAAANKATKISNVEKAKKMKALEEVRETKLKSVLSAEQFKTYIAHKAEHRAIINKHLEK